MSSMRIPARRVPGPLPLAAMLLAVATISAAQDDPLLAWRFYVDELEIESSRIARFEDPLAPADIVLRNVTIVNLPEGSLSKNHAVTISAGRIAWVGPSDEVTVPAGHDVVDGEGRYLMPGLVDMHVHTLTTSANYLTQLGAGVTTIREMDGFPWLLTRKHQAEENRLFAPSMCVTGQILNYNSFGGYARAVATPEAGRVAVREQHAEGYDAIKIHNSLSIAMFDAIIEEARDAGLDVVGHNPQPVPVAHVIQSGMRTAEHFKGYIDDATLTISKADWVTPTAGSSMYLTPTFHSYREHLRGDDALGVLNGPEGQLVHPLLRERWKRAAAEPEDELTRQRQNILAMSRTIFQTLLPHRVNWLAGTDSGSYDLMVPGPALIDELEMMEKFGLPTLEVLKAATTNAAEAMRWDHRIGRVALGLQGDLLLVRENPLETVRNLRTLEAMVLRGSWIPDAPALLHMPAEVWSKSVTPTQPPSKQEVAEHLSKRRALKNQGYAFNHFQLDELKTLIAGFGYEELASQVESLR